MVSPHLRDRISDAVNFLHYIPNHLASALASKQTQIVGVVVPSLTNGVFDDYVSAIQEVFEPAGLQVLVSNVRYSAEEEERAIGTLLGYHPEAMIIAGIDQSLRSRDLLMQSGLPVIQTMDLTTDPIDLNIGFSHEAAGHSATKYLLDLGHERIGHLATELDPRARRRQSGYQRAMDEAGIENRALVAATPEPSDAAIGAKLLSQLLDNNSGATAIFCCNDDLALGALFECQRRGIRVPDDFSIIGFNDFDFCAVASPTLTSVATRRQEMGERAAGLVLEIIRGAGKRPTSHTIDMGYTIIERASTARPAGTRRRPVRQVG